MPWQNRSPYKIREKLLLVSLFLSYYNVPNNKINNGYELICDMIKWWRYYHQDQEPKEELLPEVHTILKHNLLAVGFEPL